MEPRHQGNLSQFDPNYTDQPGLSAPPSHRATFGSYNDQSNNNPFARVAGPPPNILPHPDNNRPPPPTQNDAALTQQGPPNRHPNADFINVPSRPQGPHHMNGGGGGGGGGGPPRGSFVQQNNNNNNNNNNSNNNSSVSNQQLSIPREPSAHENSDTVNVPEWLVKEGGELRLSSTSSGNSVIRYWPSYMTVEGSRVSCIFYLQVLIAHSNSMKYKQLL